MNVGESLAHTCAQSKGWTMTGLAAPRSILVHESARGLHSHDAQVWNDNCVGNGLTIRNLKQALEQAEDLIVELKSRSGLQELESNGSLTRDVNSVLEAKLLEVQNTSNQRELEARQLRSQVSEYQAGYQLLSDQIISLIKQDLWQLPNRISLPDLHHNENLKPKEWVDHINHLLSIFEGVREDVHESRRKEVERQSNRELEGKQTEEAEYQTRINDLSKEVLELNAQLTTSLENENKLKDTLAHIQSDRLEAATRQAEDLNSLETKITELRADLGNFQNEKARLADEIRNAGLVESQLRRELGKANQEITRQKEHINSLEQTLETAAPQLQSAARASSLQESPSDTNFQRFSLKRPLSPTFGIDSSLQAISRQSTMEEEMPIGPRQKALAASQASPTPHLDELFVGGRGTTPKVSTLRVTRTRRKGVNPLIDQPSATQEESAPSTPVADGDKRRSKRTKLAKIA